MGTTGIARGRSQAIRPWPDEEACEGKDGAANEILAIYFWKNVELMSQKCQKSLSRRDGDIITSRLLPKMRLKWLAPPAEACVAVYLHANSFSVSRALAAHVMALLSRGRAARSRSKSQLGYFLFKSVARLPGNSEWTQTAWNGTNGHE